MSPLLSLLICVLPACGHIQDQPLPPVASGDPVPGKRVKQVAPEWQGTQVYHLVYLPSDWVAGQRYPVIVEYAGNNYPPLLEGKVEDCKLGYHQSGGKGFLWVVMPFVNVKEKKNQPQWWGDVPATVDYCRTNLRRVCEAYGGDPSAVFLTGFSRGAIACGYIGLHDDDIADVWLGFLPFSHHDGGSYTRSGAAERLARIKGRASFISWGARDGGKANSIAGKKLLEELRSPVAALEVPGIGHTDAWIAEDCPARQKMRAWLQHVRDTRPGTFTISGSVTDRAGKPIKGLRIESGWHWTYTDEGGRYRLRSLVAGTRSVRIAGKSFRSAPRRVAVAGADVAGIDFML